MTDWTTQPSKQKRFIESWPTCEGYNLSHSFARQDKCYMLYCQEWWLGDMGFTRISDVTAPLEVYIGYHVLGEPWNNANWVLLEGNLFQKFNSQNMARYFSVSGIFILWAAHVIFIILFSGCQTDRSLAALPSVCLIIMLGNSFWFAATYKFLTFHRVCIYI